MFGRKKKRADKQRQQAEAFVARQAARTEAIAALKKQYADALLLEDPALRLITLETVKKEAAQLTAEILNVDPEVKILLGGSVLGAIAGGTAAIILVTNPLLIGVSACAWCIFGGAAGLVAGMPFGLHRLERKAHKALVENADFLKHLHLLAQDIENAQSDILERTDGYSLKQSPFFQKGLDEVPSLKEHFTTAAQDAARDKDVKKPDNTHKPDGPRH